jgi:hypothetical protein
MLRFASLRLTLRFGEAELPRWLGSAFRGGFGQHLRRIVCYRPMRECADCERTGECLYYQTYEREFARRGHSAPPRPIILVPPFFGKPLVFEREGRLELRLLLFGDFLRNLPHTLLALQQFGSHGLGEARYHGRNRFEVHRAVCERSGKLVFDGSTIYPGNLEPVEVGEIAPASGNKFEIGFRTPIDCPKAFPPPPDRLLHMIRRRLVLYVNEYGTGERIPDFTCEGAVKPLAKHRHRLIGYSKRSGRREFWAWTGIARYEFGELDAGARWLLRVGEVLGAGGKASFGMGFFDLRELD